MWIMATTFKIGRDTGQSNTTVLIDLVKEAVPGTVFTYDELSVALSKNTDHCYSKREVQQSVALANHRLLREHKRVLRNIRNVGYKMARANEHSELADSRTRRGNRQMKWALETMENARLDEMTEQERVIHVAQTTINNQLYEVTRRLSRQQAGITRILDNLSSRVDQLEEKSS